MVDLKTFDHPSVFECGGKYWFQEKSDEAFPGQIFGLEIEEILHHEKSPFQDILMFKSATFGNVLVLNGIIQCTERDEFVYQELMTHLPIMSHPNPRRALVIGGGDCGVVRELVKHIEFGLESITMVEIDNVVIDLASKYLSGMASQRNNPHVNIVIEDGFKFLKELKEDEQFDVIITDSSDPEGPAVEFFEVDYFKLLQRALKPNGTLIMQSSENIWLNIDYLKQLMGKARLVFPNVEYCQCYMPTYTSGQLGLFIATSDQSRDLKRPLRQLTAEQEKKLFKYYNSAMHNSAFVLPTWAAEVLSPSQSQ